MFMAKTARKNLVTIEDATIQALLGRKDIVAQLPNCLGRVAKQNSGTRMKTCARCRGKRGRQVDYGKVKQCLANLQGENRRTLKAVLNARQVRVVYRNSRGQKITFTF